MTLNASGPISLVGNVVGQSIQEELGLTGPLSLTSTAARGLAKVSSGPIVMPTDFYGKSATYFLNNSLRFRSSASAYLSRTGGTPSNGKTATYSFWLKRGILSTGTQWLFAGGTTVSLIGFNAGSDSLSVLGSDTSAEGNITTAVFRDPAAWYHFVIQINTTEGAAADRAKIFINGVQQAVSTTSGGIVLDSIWGFNTAGTLNIGRYNPTASGYCDCYMAEVNFIDGGSPRPVSAFGAFNSLGVWQPIQYTGTYGNNGFYLPFTNITSTSTLGNDFSGNGNNWTTNNISITAGTTYDSMTDVPTLTSTTAANYAVFNPLRPFGGSLSNGNLTGVTGNEGSANSGYITSTIWFPSSGKFYFEVTPTSVSEMGIGITTNSNNRAGTYYRGGDIYINGSLVTSQASYTNNDVIGVAVDVDLLTIQFYKNNTAQGAARSISAIATPFVACINQLSGSNSATANINFGQQPFVYTAPSNFLPLNTFNL